MLAVKKLLAVVLFTCSLFACTPTATDGGLRDRASFDLNCAKSKLRIVDLDADTRGVRGCGQRATYVQRCQPSGYGCTWVLNNTSGDDE